MVPQGDRGIWNAEKKASLIIACKDGQKWMAIMSILDSGIYKRVLQVSTVHENQYQFTVHSYRQEIL